MGLKKLVIELTDLCNLECEYCFQKSGISHLEFSLIQRLLKDAQQWGASKITFTGGEIALYPQLEQALGLAEVLGYRYAIVTNGWHFERILPFLNDTLPALNHIFFSLDSASEKGHDIVRGRGSYARIANAVELCRSHNLPFSFLVVVNKRNLAEMDVLATLAAHSGARGIVFGHMLPTSKLLEEQLSLSYGDRRIAEAEAQRLAGVLDISVSFSASASNNAPICCEPLAGKTISVDCRGRISLCCQLADYRGAATENDIVGDLNVTGFGQAYANFLALAVKQRTRRSHALSRGDVSATYPCDFCLTTLDKTAWRDQSAPISTMVEA